jgi:hypothetical protein
MLLAVVIQLKDVSAGGGLASVVGDPHHYTFDKARIDFQGVCTYILSQYHGIEADQFQIDARYEHVGNKGDVAKLALISIDYHGDNIILGKRKKVLVNGKPVKAGYSPDDNSYRITREGDFMVFRSLSKITAAYNGRWKSRFDLPDLYRTRVEGLLGNYDGVKTNDFITRDGRKVLDNIEGHCAIGNSWQLESVEMCPYDC